MGRGPQRVFAFRRVPEDMEYVGCIVVGVRFGAVDRQPNAPHFRQVPDFDSNARIARNGVRGEFLAGCQRLQILPSRVVVQHEPRDRHAVRLDVYQEAVVRQGGADHRIQANLELLLEFLFLVLDQGHDDGPRRRVPVGPG